MAFTVPFLVLSSPTQYCFCERCSRAVDRLLPSDEAHELITLTPRHRGQGARPDRRRHEKAETIRPGCSPAGRRGLLRPASPRSGVRRPAYEVVPEVLERSRRWAAVAVRSRAQLSSHPLLPSARGSKQRGGGHALRFQIGAYSLSEPQPLRRRACAARPPPTVTTTCSRAKSWITHGSIADFYTRSPAPARAKGILLPVPGLPGCRSASPMRRWACTRCHHGGLTTTPDPRRRGIGAEGQGLSIAFSAWTRPARHRGGGGGHRAGCAGRALRYANERTSSPQDHRHQAWLRAGDMAVRWLGASHLPDARAAAISAGRTHAGLVAKLGPPTPP
jgi:hypothetical protein